MVYRLPPEGYDVYAHENYSNKNLTDLQILKEI